MTIKWWNYKSEILLDMNKELHSKGYTNIVFEPQIREK